MLSWRKVWVLVGVLVALASAGCSADTSNPFAGEQGKGGGGQGSSGSRCDGVVCTASDSCHVAGTCDENTGECSDPIAPNGKSCDDGDGCTSGDACLQGVCRGGDVRCEAKDSCHVDGVCDPTTHTCSTPTKADGVTCDDGNACTKTDACQAGACVGTDEVVCEASDDCHDPGICNAKTGECTDPAKKDGTACDDGSACTSADACVGGKCTGGTEKTCEALDGCHDPGICNPDSGECTNPAKSDGAACDDGNPCTTADGCHAGSCLAGTAVTCEASDDCHDPGLCDPRTGGCTNPAKANGTACSDGNACTKADACTSGVCTGGAAVTCAATDSCHVVGACNPATGVCSNPVKPDGAVCNDGNLCTQTDSCAAGVCKGANPVSCTASDQCHSGGTCNPATGVCDGPAKANGTVCDDGNACTKGDVCQAGLCKAPTTVTCFASDQCHAIGTCDASTGVCSNPAKANGTACNDGSACTRTDSCLQGFCLGANPVFCSASDECHGAGTCNATTGVCSNPAKANGTLCTDDRGCATGEGTCSGGLCAAPGCFLDSADRCTLAGENPKTGAVVATPLACPTNFVDPASGQADLCRVLDTTVGSPSNPTCNPATSSCARTGCVPETGVCEYKTKKCPPIGCRTYSCSPTTGLCLPDTTGACGCSNSTCTSTSCTDVTCQPGGGAQNCNVSTPVDCEKLRPDTCHVVAAAGPKGCDASTAYGCVYDRVKCPAPPDGCSEYVQEPKAASTKQGCCVLEDRCARMTETDPNNAYDCVKGTCVASAK